MHHIICKNIVFLSSTEHHGARARLCVRERKCVGVRIILSDFFFKEQRACEIEHDKQILELHLSDVQNV